MELPKVYYEKASFMETTSGNIISRQSLICGSQNMIFGGKTVVMPECIFRGDLANIRVGRYCIFLNRSVVRPPFKKFSKGVAFFPLTIGDHVFIEEDCVINAASIGSFVHIGKGAIIGRRCVLKDYCAVAPGAVLPPETVVPSYSLFGGDPGHFEEELPECTEAMMKQATVGYYKNLIPSSKVEVSQ